MGWPYKGYSNNYFIIIRFAFLSRVRTYLTYYLYYFLFSKYIKILFKYININLLRKGYNM